MNLTYGDVSCLLGEISSTDNAAKLYGNTSKRDHFDMEIFTFYLIRIPLKEKNLLCIEHTTWNYCIYLAISYTLSVMLLYQRHRSVTIVTQTSH